MLEHSSPLLLTWALSYFIHSSVLISFAFLVDKLGCIKNLRYTEMLWRFALFGAFFSASFQLFWVGTIDDSRFQHKIFIDHGASDSQLSPIAVTTATIESAKSNAVNNPSTNQTQANSHDSASAEKISKPGIAIELPLNVQSYASYAILVWILLAFRGCISIYRSIRHLNRLTALLPDADTAILQRLTRILGPESRLPIQVKLTDRFGSPFVTPNSCICIPQWIHTKLNSDQFDAMLAHEIAHILRHDPKWKIGIQILQKICCFQPLNILASRRLDLLAELACDERAVQTSGNPKKFAEALYLCAQSSKSDAIPRLALAMSRKESSLLTRIGKLLNQKQQPAANLRQTHMQQISYRCILSCGLAVFVTSMPIFAINFGKLVPDMKRSISTITKFAQELGSAVIESGNHEHHAIRKALPQKTISLAGTNSSELSHLTIPTINLEVSSPIATQSFTLTQKSEADLMTEAHQLLEKKAWPEAIPLLQSLAERGIVEAQLTLGELYWNGKNVPNNPTLAANWLRRAASKGSSRAESFLAIINEREAHLLEITYLTDQYEANEWKFQEAKCVRPDFGTVVQNTTDIENMINQVNEFAFCFNKYGEALNSLKGKARIIPQNLIRLMTDEEVDKAISRHLRALASIRLTANLIAEDFTNEKNHWEARLRETFNGLRSRDWNSLKRVTIPEQKEKNYTAINDTKLVRVETDPALIGITN